MEKFWYRQQMVSDVFISGEGVKVLSGKASPGFIKY